jgi:hypothetical protein|tara:strand:+ start:21921 stop:22352 length:432 start_codon:yes stop_codon:yes gene_type:complete
MGKILIAIVIVLLVSLPIACMTLLVDEHEYGFSFVTKKTQAEEKSSAIFEPKYPSGVIYGFIEGCYLAFEDAQYKSGELWPTDLKEICGCMMDGLREAVPVQEFIRDWGGNLTPEQESIANMFEMICTEQIIKERLQNLKDPA